MRLNPKSFEQTELTSSDSLFESSVMMSAMLSIVRRLSSDGKVENEHYIFTYFEKKIGNKQTSIRCSCTHRQICILWNNGLLDVAHTSCEMRWIIIHETSEVVPLLFEYLMLSSFAEINASSKVQSDAEFNDLARSNTLIMLEY